MKSFDRVAGMSPLPIVDLSRPSSPQDGLFLQLTSSCRNNLAKGDLCRQHYESLITEKNESNKLVQCPYGFSSFPFKSSGMKAALTGFIPFPREGGSKEKIMAKRHTNARIATDQVARVALGLLKADSHFTQTEQNVIDNYSLALHEIRKLNRNVKQTAERLCKEESKNDPERARKELVRIWKTAELMSNEFDVIEVLANANQATLPLNTVIDLYRIFDKCVRIYNPLAVGGRRLILRSEQGYSPRIPACDKTFHILPSVFIENALKYSCPGSDTRINIESGPEDRQCVVTISNECEGQQILDDRIFERGYRANQHREGSGNGLYVAQLIAQQHKTSISIQSQVIGLNKVRHSFRVLFKTVN